MHLFQTLCDYFTPTIRALIEGGVDLLAFDTVPSQKEADCILRILEQESANIPVWISFQCKVRMCALLTCTLCLCDKLLLGCVLLYCSGTSVG